MCGIAGIFSLDHRLDYLRAGRASINECLSRMVGHIVHRGPDDQGIELLCNGTAHVGLGNTRLAILDLSPAGHQPMQDTATGNWITYNGEIYNYRRLREELGAANRGQRSEVGGQKAADGGWRIANSGRQDEGQSSPDGSYAINAIDAKNALPSWQSNTDTEVILRAYARWGRECVNHLRGMFAFALWDAGRQELFLARDPFGIKPLYYHQTKESFLFASEIRALLASSLVPRRLSHEGLSSYLQYGSVQDPATIIEDVRSLLPGHYLVVNRRDTVQIIDVDYASNLFREESAVRMCNRREAVTTLRYDLEESVRLHLVSDVPVGVFLSGGIDSSAVVALTNQVTGEKPKTFSVVFGEKAFSEASYATLVAKQFSTDHHEIPLAEHELLNMLPEALGAMDQPTMDGINTFVVSKAVREAGITVALSGLGGDELFAGYPSFRRAMQLDRLATAPFTIRQLASAVGRATLNGSVRNQKFWDLLGSDCSPYAAYAISRQLFSPAEIAALTHDGVRYDALGVRHTDATNNSQSAIRNPKSEMNDLPHASRSMLYADLINEVSRYELQGYMVNTLLRDTDQMSMAHSLEVRVPFVDTVVVQSVLALPGDWKIDGTRQKPLLVDAMTGLLPQEIWRRPKMGFTLPFARWMQLSLALEVEEALSRKAGLAAVGVDFDHTQAVWKRFKTNPQREPWSRAWSLYVLKKWCDLNGIAA